MVDHVSPTNRVGQQFGNYRLLRPLSASKDSTIYLGEHIYLKTQAAIKLYHSRLLEHDQESFLAEATTLARLAHPHIARVLEGGLERDTPFLVMAYTPAGTLRLRYPVGVVLPLPVIVRYVKQIAAALDYAHHQQVLHLDIKPENMWVGHNDEILLSNFRMTLFSRNSRSQSVQDVVEAATYMAPEQIQGHASSASDQYILGIVVYEWLCGSCPFLSTNYVEIARQHLHVQPPPLCSRVPDLAPAVEQVVMRALSKHTVERFSTIQAFADALEQSYLAPWDVAVPPPVFTEHALALLPASVAEEPISIPTATKNRSMRRRIAIGLIGLAGAAAVATASGVVWFHLAPTKPIPVAVGTTLYTYRRHVDIVYAVAWSHDGKNIASWSRDDTMQVWNATTFAQVNTYPMEGVLAWSPDWRFIASGNAYNVQIWEAATGRIMIYYPVPNTGGGFGDLAVNSFVQWSPNGKYIASAIIDTHVWDVTTGKMLFSSPTGAVAWSPEGKRIALLPYEYSTSGAPVNVKLQILDVATQDLLANYTMSVTNSLFLSWSPNGKYLASGDGNIWDAATGKHIATYKGQPLTGVWSPNSQYLAAFDNSQALSLALNQYLPSGTKVDTTVHIWNVLTGEDVFVYHGHTAGVNYVAWSPDGSKIASASADMTVKVWQAMKAEHIN